MAVRYNKPFAPIMTAAVGITIAASSDRVALPAGYRHFRLHNRASEDIYLKTGNSTVTASASNTGNMTIGSGAIEILDLNAPSDGSLYLAAIGTGSTGSLNITPGSGL